MKPIYKFAIKNALIYSGMCILILMSEMLGISLGQLKPIIEYLIKFIIPVVLIVDAQIRCQRLRKNISFREIIEIGIIFLSVTAVLLFLFMFLIYSQFFLTFNMVYELMLWGMIRIFIAISITALWWTFGKQVKQIGQR